MNILYISALEGGKYSGPLHSVPKQIESQSKVDNVYWVNLTNISTADRFNKNLYHYSSLKEFKIAELPNPFNKPDLIIFEEFFKVQFCKIAREAEKRDIPYIIVPRCQMTKKYLQNKKLKKMIANIIMFSHFKKKAKAIQFLTHQEQVDSKEYYNGEFLIAPNGIDIQSKVAKVGKRDKYICTFIGRYSVWQKGLDLLMQAISMEYKTLVKHNIIFQLYGPNERTGSSQEIISLVKKYGLERLVHVNGPVFDNQKKEVFLNSDFFIHTSRFEGMPMSVLEALSYGVPCVVTKGSNLKEQVEEANAGWGATNDIDDIARVLRETSNNLHLLKMKGENAVNLSKKYSWDSIAKESHIMFKKILNRE